MEDARLPNWSVFLLHCMTSVLCVRWRATWVAKSDLHFKASGVRADWSGRSVDAALCLSMHIRIQ
jgi:hypothetical protein